MKKDKKPFSYYFFAKFFTFSLLVIIYAFYSGQMIESVNPHYSSFDRIIFVSYIILILTAVFLIFYITHLPIRLFNRHAADILYRYTSLVILSFLLIFAVFDIKLYTIMGSHIYDPFIVQSFNNSGFNNEAHLSTGTIFTIAVVFIIALILPFYIQNRWNHLGENFQKRRVRLSISVLPVAAIVFIAVDLPVLSSISKSLPFYDELGLYQTKYIEFNQDNSQIIPGRERQDYINQDVTSESAGQKKPNILIIVAESFRSDNISENLTPHLKQFYDNRSTVKSTYHYSGSHVSETSVFSLLYGLNTYNYHTFSENKIRSVPLNWLKNSGYQLSGYSANQLADWNGSSFLVSQFDKYIENPQTVPHLDDSLVVDSLYHFNKNRDRSKPFCTFVFLNSTHHNYYFPPEFEIDKPVIAQDYNHFLGDDKLEADKPKIVNRYRNSVRYTDHNFGRILKIFEKEITDGNLIIVFTGDHSEEFWDKGLLGHGAANLYNSRTQVPLLFHLPNRKGANFIFTSHEDILPTIIDYLSPSDYTKLASRFNGSSLLSAEQTDKFSIITATNFEKKKSLCLVNKSGKFWLKADFENSTMKVTRKFSFDDVEQSTFELDQPTKLQVQLVYRDFFRYVNFE